MSGKIIKYNILRQKNSEQKTNISTSLSLVSLLCSSTSVKLHAILLNDFYSAFVHKSSIKEKKNHSLNLIFIPTENFQAVKESQFFSSGSYLWQFGKSFL